MKLIVRSIVAALLVGLAGARARAADSGDVQQQLADTQDRLATALHSYSLLQDENEKLKEKAQGDADEKAALQAQVDTLRQANEVLKSAAAAAAQLNGIREQLRQSRDQIASLAQENYELKNRLAAAQGSAATAPAKSR